MSTTPKEEFIATRSSLLQRLKNWEDKASWKDFFDTYWKLIYGVARAAGLNDAEAQDVVQETIIGVAQKMPRFEYDSSVGSFKSWLMRLTQWRITDQFRKKQYEKAGRRYPREESLGTSLLEQQPGLIGFDLESAWNEEWHKQLLQASLQKAKQRVNPIQFQMFYLHVVKNVPAKKVAERLDVKLAEVYFAKYKVSAVVKKEYKTLEEKMT